MFKHLLLLFFLISFKIFSIPHYYCIAADDRFYHLLENLIGSIHCFDKEIEEIAVYDLGLTKAQINTLRRFYKVTVNKVELTNPQLLTPILTAPNGRQVRGCFSWKPVVIKQALEKFPYILYIDAGLCLMNDPDDIFRYINETGYFFLSYQEFNIADRITNTVLNQLVNKDFFDKKELILNTKTMICAAGLQGISRQIYNNYVLPAYEYSKNIELYLDNIVF